MRWPGILMSTLSLTGPMALVAQAQVPGPTPAQASTAQVESQSQGSRDHSGGATGSSAVAARKHRAAKRGAATPAQGGAPKKVVVREGGVDEPTSQIVTGMLPEEADQQRREAELLLSTTVETLKEIAPRQLDLQQQETVSQIQNYMKVAHNALREGDVPRAHMLAVKAGLLADDLRRP